MNIYVGNLPHATTESELTKTFSEYGSVDSVKIITDRETGMSRGFGFIEMSDEGEARKAVQVLDGKELGGRSLTVNEARPRNHGSQSGF